MIKATEYCLNVFDGTHDSPKPTKTGYKLLTSKNILNGIIDSSDAYFISEQDFNSINERSKVKKWDILFSMIGTVGNVCLLKDDNVDFAIKNMGVFSTGDEYKAKWLYFYLKSPIVMRKIQYQINGAVQKFLPLGWLRNLEIPEYKEDKKMIVDLLWSIEEKTFLNDSIILEINSMAKTIYDYWFLQFNFPDDNGKPYKSSGGKMVWSERLKREIPEGWDVVKLGQISETDRGVTYTAENLSDSGIPLISLASISRQGTYIPDGIKYYRGTYNSKKLLNSNELIMCNTDMTQERAVIGKCILLPDIFDEPVLSTHHITHVNLFNRDLKYYFYLTTQTKWFHNYIKGFSSGTNVLGLDVRGFNDYNILIPSKKILDKFNDFVIPTEKRKNMLIKEVQELRSLYDFLFPLLMNGQVTFKGTSL